VEGAARPVHNAYALALRKDRKEAWRGSVFRHRAQEASSAKPHGSYSQTFSDFPEAVLQTAEATRDNWRLRPVSPELPVDMWTIGLQPNASASPVFSCAKRRGNARFAHIPTGNRNNKEGFIILIGESRAGGLCFQHPALRQACDTSRGPAQKVGPVFFARRKRAKNLPVPPQAALLTGSAAAPRSSYAGSGRRDGPFPNRTKGWRFKQAPLSINAEPGPGISVQSRPTLARLRRFDRPFNDFHKASD
jgi:hypothetical protein